MNSYDILGDFGGGVLNPNYNPEQSPFSSLKYPLHAETIYALTDSGEAPSGARFAYGKLKFEMTTEELEDFCIALSNKCNEIKDAFEKHRTNPTPSTN